MIHHWGTEIQRQFARKLLDTKREQEGTIVTQDSWISARRWVWSFVLVITIVAGGLYVGLPATAASAAVADVPPGLVKGAHFDLIFRAEWGVLSRFEVQEVRGDWVRATPVGRSIWGEGQEVWINLRAVDQIAIYGPKKP